jgi:hypothetical protein
MQGFILTSLQFYLVEMKNVYIITVISLGITGLSLLIPTVIVPAYEKFAHAGSCSDLACATSTYGKCEQQWEKNATSTFAILKGGVDGIVCMWNHSS